MAPADAVLPTVMFAQTKGPVSVSYYLCGNQGLQKVFKTCDRNEIAL